MLARATRTRGISTRQGCCRFSRCLATETAADEFSWSRLARFQSGTDGETYFGALNEACTRGRPEIRSPSGLKLSDTEHDVDIILPPLEPPAIFAIGLNYRAHAAETQMDGPRYPVVLMKAPGSVIGHEQLIVIPRVCQDAPEVDFEGELAVVIGAPAKDVAVDTALNHVLGYTIANDVSARRWQGKKGGGQWTRAKSFDTFCPLGPFLVPPKFAGDPDDMTITTKVNGVTMQSANTSDMVHSVAELISFLSQGTTLQPGTVILTGTPSGVGYVRNPPVFLKRGDKVDISISRLGTLSNSVAEAGHDDEIRL